MMGFWDLVRLELRTLLADRAIMLTLFGGVIFYSFLYPQPYLHQLPREEAVVVVNEDGSQLSRQLEFMADATPQVQATLESGDARITHRRRKRRCEAG